MREDNNHPVDHPLAGGWACLSKIRFYLCILAVVVSVGNAHAQCPPWNDVFYHGERMDYEVSFKWGLLLSKAGIATFSVKEVPFRNEPAWEYKLLFRTQGLFEKVYRMRDTLTTYYTPNRQLLYSSKRTHEGGYYLVEELTFRYDRLQTKAHSLRYTPTTTKIDTVLTSTGCMFDMMAACMHLRSLDWEEMQRGDRFDFKIAVGRDIVHASFRYTGPEILEPSGVSKYNTRHFFIDIYDEAFSQKKEAAEVWVGDDANRLPIKVRAKLKIGAAEVYLKDTYNLQHPMKSRMDKK